MTILEKYNSIKDNLKNGDIILFRGSAFISKSIEFFDHAYFSHSGVILKTDDQLFILDSTFDKKVNGVEVDFLINTIKSEVDFCVLRPKTNIKQTSVSGIITTINEATIRNALSKAIEQGIEGFKYNFWFYLQFLIYRFFKWDETSITSKHAYVCSQFVQFYTDQLGINEYRADKLITPEDIYNLRNPNDIDIIIDKGV